LHYPPDVVSRGAVALLPAVDSRWLGSESGQPIALLVGLAVIAIVALLVAAIAYQNDAGRHARRRVDDDSELFTTTPLPMSKEEVARAKHVAPEKVYGAHGLPRWVQLGSLLVAVGITFVVSQRLRQRTTAAPDDADASPVIDSRVVARPEVDDDSPESLDFSPEAPAPFAFRARDWVATNGGCAARLEVTKGVSSAWPLIARVHDGQGQLIDTARMRVASLREGEIIEFRFARASCERIGAWDVRVDR
jgi:hypothetical protein